VVFVVKWGARAAQAPAAVAPGSLSHPSPVSHLSLSFSLSLAL